MRDLHPDIARRLRDEDEYRRQLAAELHQELEAALDAAGLPPDSAAARYARANAPDAACLVRRFDWAHRRPRPVCRQLAAVDIVIAAQRETARGVRTIGAK